MGWRGGTRATRGLGVPPPQRDARHGRRGSELRFGLMHEALGRPESGQRLGMVCQGQGYREAVLGMENGDDALRVDEHKGAAAVRSGAARDCRDA